MRVCLRLRVCMCVRLFTCVCVCVVHAHVRAQVCVCVFISVCAHLRVRMLVRFIYNQITRFRIACEALILYLFGPMEENEKTAW